MRCFLLLFNSFVRVIKRYIGITFSIAIGNRLTFQIDRMQSLINLMWMESRIWNGINFYWSGKCIFIKEMKFQLESSSDKKQPLKNKAKIKCAPKLFNSIDCVRHSGKCGKWESNKFSICFQFLGFDTFIFLVMHYYICDEHHTCLCFSICHFISIIIIYHWRYIDFPNVFKSFLFWFFVALIFLGLPRGWHICHMCNMHRNIQLKLKPKPESSRNHTS